VNGPGDEVVEQKGSHRKMQGGHFFSEKRDGHGAGLFRTDAFVDTAVAAQAVVAFDGLFFRDLDLNRADLIALSAGDAGRGISLDGCDGKQAVHDVVPGFLEADVLAEKTGKQKRNKENEAFFSLDVAPGEGCGLVHDHVIAPEVIDPFCDDDKDEPCKEEIFEVPHGFVHLLRKASLKAWEKLVSDLADEVVGVAEGADPAAPERSEDGKHQQDRHLHLKFQLRAENGLRHPGDPGEKKEDGHQANKIAQVKQVDSVSVFFVCFGGHVFFLVAVVVYEPTEK